MKWLLQLLLFITCYSSILSLENCNKMWGMSNEINGIQVSKIGIYMYPSKTGRKRLSQHLRTRPSLSMMNKSKAMMVSLAFRSMQ